jgi:Zn-dependent protease with chaperone function
MSGGAGLRAFLFDGRHPVRTEVVLSFEGDVAWVAGAELQCSYAARDLQVSPRIGGADRFIALPDGRQLQCADDALLDRLPGEAWSEGWVAALERRWPVALACVAIVAIVVAAAYFFGLPWASKKVADGIPIASEEALGRKFWEGLDGRLLGPTSVEEERRRRIGRVFEQLRAGLGPARSAGLEFRESKLLGANAFALPAGRVVVTDGLVRLASTDDEILAVLAHELGHVEHRHVLRKLLQGSAVAVVISAITGDAASLGVGIAALPTIFAQLTYSRELETEADDFAFGLLTKNGISPEAFATAMEKLSKDRGRDSEYHFASTHPITADRIARARQAARAAGNLP